MNVSRETFEKTQKKKKRESSTRKNDQKSEKGARKRLKNVKNPIVSRETMGGG